MEDNKQEGSNNINVEGNVKSGAAVGYDARVEADIIAGRDVNINEVHHHNYKTEMRSKEENNKSDGLSKGRDLSQKELDRLTEKLLKCPSMKNKGSRDEIVSRLRSGISGLISRDTRDLVDVRNIVATCSNYTNGIKDLLEAVRYYESDSYTMHEVDNLLQELESSPQDTEAQSSRPPPMIPALQIVKREQILVDIEQIFGYNWMFVTLYANIIRYGSQEMISALVEWLQMVTHLSSNSTSAYGWQLLCLDKQIQLIGVKNMPNEFMCLFFKKLPSTKYDAPRFFRLASKRVNDQIQLIISGSETLIQRQTLARYVNLLNQTISHIEELEKELASIKYALGMFDCLANEKNEVLPQEEMDYCLGQLKNYLHDSIKELDASGTPVMVRVNIENRLEQLKDQNPNYRKWLMILANNIENTRKHVFSHN